MVTIRPSNERGHFNFDWLDTYHTFSFADYLDPEHMNFRSLRVINEDRIAPGAGFPTHAHRDMEIITYILEGELEHKDSMGNGSIIKPGEVQKMSAGTGVKHSEYNHSKNNPAHLLQIWILPDQAGLKPSYEQRVFGLEEKLNKLCLVASGKSGEGIVKIHQDVNLLVSSLEKGREIGYPLEKDRHAWIQVARGAIKVNQTVLKAGDGAAISGEKFLTINSDESSEILLFNLA